MVTSNTYIKKAMYVVLAIMFSLSLIYSAYYYRVNHGTNKQVSAYNICKNIKNNGPYDIFIPTRTQQEWNSFLHNPPPNVILEQCGPKGYRYIQGSGYGIQNKRNTIDLYNNFFIADGRSYSYPNLIAMIGSLVFTTNDWHETCGISPKSKNEIELSIIKWYKHSNTGWSYNMKYATKVVDVRTLTSDTLTYSYPPGGFGGQLKVTKSGDTLIFDCYLWSSRFGTSNRAQIKYRIIY